MKKNELKAIERALNKKSEVSVVDIANEIGYLVGWQKYYYISFTQYLQEMLVHLDYNDAENMIAYLTSVAKM